MPYVCVWPAGGPGGKYGAISARWELKFVAPLEERPGSTQCSRVVFDPAVSTLKSNMIATKAARAASKPRLGALATSVESSCEYRWRS